MNESVYVVGIPQEDPFVYCYYYVLCDDPKDEENAVSGDNDNSNIDNPDESILEEDQATQHDPFMTGVGNCGCDVSMRHSPLILLFSSSWVKRNKRTALALVMAKILIGLVVLLSFPMAQWKAWNVPPTHSVVSRTTKDNRDQDKKNESMYGPKPRVAEYLPVLALHHRSEHAAVSVNRLDNTALLPPNSETLMENDKNLVNIDQNEVANLQIIPLVDTQTFDSLVWRTSESFSTMAQTTTTTTTTTTSSSSLSSNAKITTLVMFYCSWCPYTAAALRALEEFVAQLNQEHISNKENSNHHHHHSDIDNDKYKTTSFLRVATVDCVQTPHLCARQFLFRFPTIRRFDNGQFISDLEDPNKDGDITASILMDFWRHDMYASLSLSSSSSSSSSLNSAEMTTMTPLLSMEDLVPLGQQALIILDDSPDRNDIYENVWRTGVRSLMEIVEGLVVYRVHCDLQAHLCETLLSNMATDNNDHQSLPVILIQLGCGQITPVDYEAPPGTM